MVLKFGNSLCIIVHDAGIGLGQGTLELLLADIMEYDFEMGEGNAGRVQCDGHQN